MVLGQNRHMDQQNEIEHSKINPTELQLSDSWQRFQKYALGKRQPKQVVVEKLEILIWRTS